MSMGELFFIGVIILLVVPPEKLPGLAREVARFLNDIRRTTSGVWDEIKKDTPNPMEDLRKQKQEVEEYMKMIGSDGKDNHNKDNPHFQPVYVKPVNSPPETAVSQAPDNSQPSAAAQTPPPQPTPPQPTPTVDPTKPKDEPDKQ